MSLADDTEAFAAYLNAPRDFLAFDEQRQLDEDTEKARAAMERSWLEAKLAIPPA